MVASWSIIKFSSCSFCWVILVKCSHDKLMNTNFFAVKVNLQLFDGASIILRGYFSWLMSHACILFACSIGPDVNKFVCTAYETYHSNKSSNVPVIRLLCFSLGYLILEIGALENCIRKKTIFYISLSISQLMNLKNVFR